MPASVPFQEMTVAEVLRSWSWDPVAMGALGLLALLYARGLAHRPGARLQVIPWWRPVLFYAGLATVLFALVSPLDALAARLFSAHMVQHMLLIMVGVPLLLLGAPVLPLTRGVPRAVRSRLLVPLARLGALRFLARLLTAPLVAWSLYVGAFWAWHLPGLYSAALTDETVHVLEHLSFLGTALLFWWNVIDPVPLRGRLPYLGRFAYVILALVQSTPLAAILTFASTAWYRPYAEGARLWGLDARADQMMGGLIMWVAGWALYFIAFSALFFVALAKEEESARRDASPPTRASEAGA